MKTQRGPFGCNQDLKGCLFCCPASHLSVIQSKSLVAFTAWIHWWQPLQVLPAGETVNCSNCKVKTLKMRAWLSLDIIQRFGMLLFILCHDVIWWFGYTLFEGVCLKLSLDCHNHLMTAVMNMKESLWMWQCKVCNVWDVFVMTTLH